MSLAGHGHSFLLHGFQQSGLGLGRGAVDFIGQQDVAKDRAALEFEGAVAPSVTALAKALIGNPRPVNGWDVLWIETAAGSGEWQPISAVRAVPAVPRPPRAAPAPEPAAPQLPEPVPAHAPMPELADDDGEPDEPVAADAEEDD